MEDINDSLTRLTAPGEPLAGFPKSAITRETFVRNVAALCAQIAERGVALDQQNRDGLIVKLARYAAKRQWNLATVESILPTMADAISAKPDVLSRPAITLTKILNLHNVHNQQQAAELRRKLLLNSNVLIEAPILFANADGDYKLVECISQRHLEEETAALGHCVGGTHLEHYRDKLLRGDVRIFSLRTSQGIPVATIEYDVRDKNIEQIEGKPRLITGNEPFFPALCQALDILTKTIPVGLIAGLPKISGKVLVRTGAFETFEVIKDVDDILDGTVVLDRETTDDLLKKLCASPRLRLDLTDFDIMRLHSHVRCSLLTRKASINLPQLQTCGNISARNAMNVNLPQLQRSGHIDVSNATSVNLPQLLKSEHIDVPNATSVTLPQLQRSGYINANSATNLNLPQLQTTGAIYAYRVTSFSLPQLQTCGNIYPENATSLNLPQLRTSGEIDANSATSLNLPQLQICGKIDVPKATSLSLPQLRTSGDIDAKSVTSLNLPKLQICGKIDARRATNLNLLQIQTCGHIYAGRLTNLNLPQLQTSGDIDARSATSLSLPQLQTCGDIEAGNATAVNLPKLQTCGHINALSATSVSLPQRRISGSIIAPKAA